MHVGESLYVSQAKNSTVQTAETIASLISQLIPIIDTKLQEPFFDVAFDMQEEYNPKMSEWLKDTKRPDMLKKLELFKEEVQKNSSSSCTESTYIKTVLLLSEIPYDTVWKIRNATLWNIKNVFPPSEHITFFDDVKFMQMMHFSEIKEQKLNLYQSAEFHALCRELKDKRSERGIRRFEMLKEWVKGLPPDQVASHEFEMDMTQLLKLSTTQYNELLKAKAD